LLTSSNRSDKLFANASGVIMLTMAYDGTQGLNTATQGKGNKAL